MQNKKASQDLSNKALKASSFANRSGIQTLVITKISTITELLKILSDKKPHTMTIDACNHSPWIIVNTTLDTDKLRPCQKHLWACWNKTQSIMHGGKSNMKVSCVFKMPMGEIFFLCEGLTLPTVKNYNFPEFLAPHMHSAKTTFEALNETTKAIVPKLNIGDSYALGICATPETWERKLQKPIKIVLDGISHTITKF